MGQLQTWSYYADGTIRLKANPNFCLNLHWNNAVDGGLINLWTVNGNQSQQWTFNTDGTIRHTAHPGFCLNLHCNNTTDGGTINLWSVNGDRSQQWKLNLDGTIRYTANQTFCINLKDGVQANGAVIELRTQGSGNYEMPSLFANGNMGHDVAAIVWLSGDLDGNGLADLIQVVNNNSKLGFAIYSWDGNQFAANSSLSIDVIPNSGWGSVPGGWLIGDINGDGRDEILQLWNNNSRLGINVFGPKGGQLNYLWAGTMDPGYGAVKFLIGDVNHDGRAEVIQLWDNGGQLGMIVYGWSLQNQAMNVIYSNPVMGQTSSAVQWFVGDVNNDQKAEVVQLWDNGGHLGMTVYGWPDDVTRMATLFNSGNMGATASTLNYLLADVNGDGCAEVVQCWNNNGRLGMVVYGWLNGAMTRLGSNDNTGQGAGAVSWLVGDINKDGKAEVLQQWNNNGKLGMIVYTWSNGTMQYMSNCGDMGHGYGAICWFAGKFISPGRSSVLQLWNNNNQLGLIAYGQGPTVFTGAVFPHYHVLSVVYSPPGSSIAEASKVLYTQGSSVVSTTSSSKSFTTALGISVEVKAEIGPNSVQGTSHISLTQSQSSSSSVEVCNSESSNRELLGPTVDGINHDYDRFLLWLNPQVDVTITDGYQTHRIGARSEPPNIMTIALITVGQLRGTQPMSGPVLQQLTAAGIAPAEYTQILSLNPFASGHPLIDQDRFRQLGETFPYAPTPLNAGQFCTSQSLDKSVTKTTSSTSSTEISVGIEVKTEFGFSDFFSASLTRSNTWTWTHSESSSNSQSTSTSRTVTIYTPSPNYAGPPTIRVYLDKIFGTFMFAYEP